MPPISATSLARLPYELRSQIWSLAVEPRHITNVRSEKSEPVFKKKPRRWSAVVFYETTSTPAPAVMHVCRESRQHAPYQRAFTAGIEPRWTWVNFDLDVFCVSSVYSINHIVSHRSEVQRLQIRTDDDSNWYEAATIYRGMEALYDFTSLRDIQVVLQPGDLMWGDAFAIWYPFGNCPRENVTFLHEGSGLVLNGPQLQMVGHWRMVFAFDCEGNPPADADSLSDEIEYALRDDHLTLAQMHEID